jgi:hypothetical protein
VVGLSSSIQIFCGWLGPPSSYIQIFKSILIQIFCSYSNILFLFQYVVQITKYFVHIEVAFLFSSLKFLSSGIDCFAAAAIIYLSAISMLADSTRRLCSSSVFVVCPSRLRSVLILLEKILRKFFFQKNLAKFSS